MGYRRDLWEIAAAHHGVIAFAEAEDAGVPAVRVGSRRRGVVRCRTGWSSRPALMCPTGT